MTNNATPTNKTPESLFDLKPGDELPADVAAELDAIGDEIDAKFDDDEGYREYQKRDMERTLVADAVDASYAIRTSSDKEFFTSVHAYCYAQAVAARVENISDDDAELVHICLNLSEEIMTTTKQLWWCKCTPLLHSIGRKHVVLDDNGSRRRNMVYAAKGLLDDIKEHVPWYVIDQDKTYIERPEDTVYTLEFDLSDTALDGVKVDAKKGDTVNISRELRKYVADLYFMLDEALSEYLYS